MSGTEPTAAAETPEPGAQGAVEDAPPAPKKVRGVWRQPLAITGFPLTAGFMSKDAILWSAFASDHGAFARVLDEEPHETEPVVGRVGVRGEEQITEVGRDGCDDLIVDG